MAEDLKATRPLAGHDEAAPASSEGPARGLSGEELSARGPRLAADTTDAAGVAGAAEAGVAGWPDAASPTDPDADVGPVKAAMAAAQPQPVRRWVSRANSVSGIERELARIWSTMAARPGYDGEHHVAARSSVLNLVVVSSHPEIAERCATTVARMAGRHPSRSIILAARDPDGPAALDAQIEAQCVTPPSGTAEACAEMVYVTTSGDTSRHLAGIIVPLLVHDLPVALWWPHDPQFRSHRADRLLPIADELIVDGSSWSGNGLERLADMAYVARTQRLIVADFALIRQARWREALASVYDKEDLRPHLRAIRSITVEYAVAEEGDPGALTNVVKPIYHVAWLASRLGMAVQKPLWVTADGSRAATLRQGRRTVAVALRPRVSAMRPGTTLRVEIVSNRRGQELVGDVTAEQQTVDVALRENGVERAVRSFLAPRQSDAELLVQAVEESRPDPVAAAALAMAAHLVQPPDSGGHATGGPAAPQSWAHAAGAPPAAAPAAGTDQRGAAPGGQGG